LKLASNFAGSKHYGALIGPRITRTLLGGAPWQSVRAIWVADAVVFEQHEVVRLVRLAVEREGGQSAFAKRHGVDRAFINMILNGKRHVSDSVAKALKLRKLFMAD
jgi:hypothetical protein